jgi:glutathione S-transferase
MITITNFQNGVRGVRVAWLCEEMGLAYRPVIVPFPTPADYRAKYPLGSVPFLEDAGAVAIGESLAMLLYLAGRYGPTPLLPHDRSSHARVLQLAMMSEAALGGHLNGLLAAKFAAPVADKRNWSVGFAESQISRVLDYIAAQKGEHAFLAGASFSLADIAIATALGMWEKALGGEIPPELRAWLGQVRERPAYIKARQAFA